MQKLKIRQGDWVVVCDGKKALVLENVGDEKFLNLKTREAREQPDRKTHELGTDAPGRSFSSVGSGRSAVEQTDWHEQEEHRFLQALAISTPRSMPARSSRLSSSRRRVRSVYYGRPIPTICAPRCVARLTRTSSSFPSTRSRSIWRDDAIAPA
jgi:hypothetical protein